MSTCQTCGGLIAEPNKAYGYAGKFCHCTWPRLPLFDPDRVFPHQPAPHMNDFQPKSSLPLHEQLRAIAPNAPMTPEQFVLWLRGYLAGSKDAAFDPVRAQLEKTGGPR